VVYPFAIAVMGLGFYMNHNTLQTFATLMAPDARGSPVALFATSYFLAQVVAAPLAGRLFDLAGPSRLFAIAAAMMALLGLYIVRRASPHFG
jgi:MFS family permease